jgi:large subunit ribosomal protein L17
MRHRRKGRVLGRSPSHQRALLRNLATAIFLTERNAEDDENAPKIKGRIVTTLQKAKEVRPVVERCITIAIHSMKHTEAAQPYAPPTEADGSIDRTSELYREWKKGADAKKYRKLISPVIAARRRVFSILRDRLATRICFADVAPRFVGRQGGYTRVLKLAKPRLGDAGTRAILEFVGRNDRTPQPAPVPQIEAEEPAAT